MSTPAPCDDAQLVRGPRKLLEAMRKRARDEGRPIAALWRRAAELYLIENTLVRRNRAKELARTDIE